MALVKVRDVLYEYEHGLLEHLGGWLTASLVLTFFDFLSALFCSALSKNADLFHRFL